MPGFKQTQYEFGKFPLHVNLLEDGSHLVEAAEQQLADECGILPAFTKEQLPAMAARALAYGYNLVVQKVETQEGSNGNG